MLPQSRAMSFVSAFLIGLALLERSKSAASREYITCSMHHDRKTTNIDVQISPLDTSILKSLDSVLWMVIY